MHQDIQNFSQIMDIDIHNKIILKYKIKIHRKPVYNFSINGVQIHDTEGTLYFDLGEEITITANETSGQNAIEFESLTINGDEILKKYMHIANPPTHWIENCPHWELKIPKHYHAWYQEITGHGEIF